MASLRVSGAARELGPPGLGWSELVGMVVARTRHNEGIRRIEIVQNNDPTASFVPSRGVAHKHSSAKCSMIRS